MPCAFELQHPLRKTSGCQFLDEEKTFTFAGKEWCRFHLPVEADGERSRKSDWRPQEIRSFSKAVFKILEETQDTEVPADFSGVVFPGTIHITSEKDGSGNPVPLPPILFLNAVFRDSAGFNGTTFGGDAQFNGATFGGAAGFYGATFRGKAGFKGAAFGSDAMFDRAAFGGYARFTGATFEGAAGFSRVRFEGNAGFIKATFGDDANFKVTTFGSRTWFNEATFRSDAWFEEARFKGHAGFEGAKFGGNAEFTWAKFGGTARFKGAKFERDASFANALFNGVTSFNGGYVVGAADFSGSVSAGADAADSFRRISFDGRNFHGAVLFTNRRFLGPASFRETKFGTKSNTAPGFHNCTLHQDTDFTRTKFRVPKPKRSWRRDGIVWRRVYDEKEEKKLDDAARAYRTLKLAMERVRARQEEADFYALEQKSLRERKRTPGWKKLFPYLWEKLLSHLYEATSDFGRSVLRPLCWLAGIQIAFFITYYLTIHLTLSGIENIPRDFLSLSRFTLTQLVMPFRIFLSDPGLPLRLAILASFHAAFNLSLIALLLLALRWRFRRG